MESRSKAALTTILLLLVFKSGETANYTCEKNYCSPGYCILKANSTNPYFCICPLIQGYIPYKVDGVLTCVTWAFLFKRYSNSLVAASNPIPGTNSVNKHFRHISVGYIGLPGQPPAWNFTKRWNWTSADVISPIKDQKDCKACSSFSTVAAMESLFRIQVPSFNPGNISVQQFLDCGIDSCSGGWIADTLSYAAKNLILSETTLPYVATARPEFCTSNLLSKGLFSISMFEEVKEFGWIGLLLAVQQQPVIVAVQASSAAFYSYKSGVFNDPNCYSSGLDHAMVVVGYDLTAPVPYWILRNSWGVAWGEYGHMRLAIAEGDGICGINVLPGYYPVIETLLSDPCNLGSFGSKGDMLPGRQNPCGGGTCVPKFLSYTCTCKAPFVAVTGIDGSQTCAPASPCTFYSKNPCGVGTCLDSTLSPGDYTCVCPIGYSQGISAMSGAMTCAPATMVSGPQKYTVPPLYNVSCEIVFTLYGMTVSLFRSMNPNIDCQSFIPENTVVNVTNNLGNCSVPYAVNTGDTCESIYSLFSSQLSTNVSGPGSPNPDLDCSNLQLGQLICIQRGSVLTDNSLCTGPYLPRANDTCQSIISTFFGGDAFSFFKTNPGLYCGRLGSTIGSMLMSSVQICLQALPFGTVLRGCTTGRYYTVKSGDTCFKLLGTIYGTAARFTSLNGVSCTSSLLIVGRLLCAP